MDAGRERQIVPRQRAMDNPCRREAIRAVTVVDAVDFQAFLQSLL
jgi:hypothetical protein